MPISVYIPRVPRPRATLDAFTAIGEPRRRAILDALATLGPLGVTALVAALGWPQPLVSKHLAILREAGIVTREQEGRERIYSLRADKLREVHDWVRAYERFWDHHIDRIKSRAERTALAQARAQHTTPRTDRSHKENA